jgi:hypothetical protein
MRAQMSRKWNKARDSVARKLERISLTRDPTRDVSLLYGLPGPSIRAEGTMRYGVFTRRTPSIVPGEREAERVWAIWESPAETPPWKDGRGRGRRVQDWVVGSLGLGVPRAMGYRRLG